MSSRGWRNLCFVLGAVCIVQLWRDCHRAPEDVVAAECPAPAASARPGHVVAADGTGGERAPAAPAEPAPSGLSFYGFSVPPWAVWLAPHPGEDLRSYRDRVLPLAQSAIAPQRARVARSRDSFAALANLDDHQRAELDGATQEAASALEERVMGAVMNGELAPSAFKPMAGVGLARDMLDIVGRGNRRFLDSLTDDQRAKLAGSPFDFGDYLVFSTPWENALSFLD
ncbi:MAG TPA: hypothetical protein VH165_14370 [Kofleriaceae bacterium]|jgi:hypothetical protein|nr:hypothetical protein [Kofleriaceae bacterium]